MRDATARQLEYLRAIDRHVRQHGHHPTVRELGATMGARSTNTVADHLRALARKGLVVPPEKADLIECQGHTYGEGSKARGWLLTKLGVAAARGSTGSTGWPDVLVTEYGQQLRRVWLAQGEPWA